MASTYPMILYDSILSGSSLSATATSVGYSVDNLDDCRSYTHWQMPSSGTVTITIHCTAARAANALGIVGHDLYSKGATVSLQCCSANSATAGEWTTALAGFTPADDYACLKQITSATKEWWKVTVACSTLAKIGEILLGDKLQFPAKPLVPLEPYSIGVQAESHQSKTGHLLGSVIRFRPVKLSHKIPPTESNYTWWTTSYWSFWLNHGSALKPFLYAMDLDYYPNDVFWACLDEGNAYALPMEMAGRVETITIEMKGMLE